MSALNLVGIAALGASNLCQRYWTAHEMAALGLVAYASSSDSEGADPERGGNDSAKQQLEASTSTQEAAAISTVPDTSILHDDIPAMKRKRVIRRNGLPLFSRPVSLQNDSDSDDEVRDASLMLRLHNAVCVAFVVTKAL